MRCGRCHGVNRPGVKFCEDCGAVLAPRCDACGSELAAGKRFCGDCGAPIAGAAAGSPGSAQPPTSLVASAPEGERKHVTVMFCDVVGSTGYAERLGAEAFRDLLNRFFSSALSEVTRFGGRVDKLLGDGFMAVFGAPMAHEDHARRAVLAALEARRRIADGWLVASEEALEVRFGIDTGTVVVGQVGGEVVREDTAVGEIVNVAARLQGLARPGDILVSEATERLVSGYVRLEAVGPLEVRGKRDRVGAYRVLAAGPRRTPLDAAGERTLSRFVGRARHLRTLNDLLARALEGEGQVVGVVGEPGIGKSRLIHEFRSSLGRTRLTYLQGQCLSFGSKTPYLPIADLVRGNCGIVASDDVAKAAAKLRAGLEAVGLDEPERIALLLQMLGMEGGRETLAELSPEAIQTQTFETLRQLVLGGSRRRPLVVVVEDVHWIDATSERFLATLAGSIMNRAVLLLTSHRPGYRPPWADLSASTQISVRPLGPADSLSIVRSVFGLSDLPEELGRTILARADGNPFFIEELARVASDQGQISSVPGTVQDVLMSRVDRLDEVPRRLLQTAAVLGREFTLRLLAAVWEESDELDGHLVQLQRGEFLHEAPDAREPTYVFKHALTQDVVYESLLSSRRRMLHDAAGRALEAMYSGRPEEAYDRLAHHWSHAGNSVKAVRYLGAAADVSFRRYAHEEAAAALREAIHQSMSLPEPEDRRQRISLTLRNVHSLYFMGRMTESLELLDGLEEAVLALDDPALTGTFHFWRAHTYSHLGDARGADRDARLALEVAERSGDERTAGLALYVQCREGWWTGRFREGIAQGRRSAEILERVGERWWLGHCHFFIAHSLYNLGEFDLAIAEAAAGEAIGDAIGDPRLRSWAAWAAGQYQAERGETEDGVARCLRAVALSPDVPNTAWAVAALGFVHRERGEIESAIEQLERAIELARSTSHPRIHARFTIWLSDAYLRAGDHARARLLAVEAREQGALGGCRWVVGHAERATGRAAERAGDVSEACDRLGRALVTYEEIDARFDQAITHLDLCGVHRAAGRSAEARRHAERAAELLGTLPAPRYRRRAEETLAKLAGAAL